MDIPCISIYFRTRARNRGKWRTVLVKTLQENRSLDNCCHECPDMRVPSFRLLIFTTPVRKTVPLDPISSRLFWDISEPSTYLIAPWSRVLPDKLIFPQLVTKFSASYETRMFITTFTTHRHLSLSWSKSIQSMPLKPTSSRSTLILFSHLRLGLPSGLLSKSSPTETLYAPLQFRTHATCPTNLILLDVITRIILGEDYVA